LCVVVSLLSGGFGGESGRRRGRNLEVFTIEISLLHM